MTHEWLWAFPTGDGSYRIDNIPFFAYDINYGDIVRCEPDPDGKLMLSEVVEPSGHLTFRLKFSDGILPADEAAALADIDAFNVMREKGAGGMHALSAPSDTDMPELFRCLVGKHEEGVLTSE